MDHELPSDVKDQLLRLWKCRNLRRHSSSFCLLEKQWEEEIVPTQCLRKIPQIFENPRVHSQKTELLDCHRWQWPFLRLLHLQEEEEAGQGLDDSVQNKAGRDVRNEVTKKIAKQQQDNRQRLPREVDWRR